MKIAIPKERREHERRVALSPEVVGKIVKMGFEVVVEKGAGLASSITDQAYEAAGATLEATFKKTIEKADIVIKVQPPLLEGEGSENEADAFPEGVALVGILAPYTHQNQFDFYKKKKVSAFSLDMAPRITRAQSMDVLSSQSNLGGYRAVIEASNEFNRAFPMMMTAAGTVPPARVLILGAGVAGLQAIATAKRLGAIVSAFDVREIAKEQVESLGASFISVPQEARGEDKGGYAKEMDDTYKARQAELIRASLATHDIVISTALIPGRPAPLLITKEMVQGMKPGSVIVDMAVEAGGNCELSQLGKVIETKEGIKIVGYANLPSRIPKDASALYARNVLSFLSLILDEETKDLKTNFKEDEIVRATLLTWQGETVHENFSKKEKTV